MILYISRRCHHDRVMQLNWLYFCGIWQSLPLKVWPNTTVGCNHQSVCMPQLQSLCSASCSGTDVLPRRNDGSGKPCAVDWASHNIDTHSGTEPGTSGSTVQSSNHYSSQKVCWQSSHPTLILYLVNIYILCCRWYNVGVTLKPPRPHSWLIVFHRPALRHRRIRSTRKSSWLPPGTSSIQLRPPRAASGKDSSRKEPTDAADLQRSRVVRTPGGEGRRISRFQTGEYTVKNDNFS